MVWLILGFAVGLAAGFFAMRFRRRPKYLATIEYWVYLPSEQMPLQNAVMERVTRGNPHQGLGGSPIGPAEALLFSDVRLHFALVLKSKNPHAFRPDLFAAHVEPTPADLRALAEAVAFAKVRFVSDEPLSHKRHVQIVTHAADAVAALGEGVLVYDVVTERLMSPSDFSQSLDNAPDALSPALHVRTVKEPGPSGASVETRGLQKIGIRELATATLELDEVMLAENVLMAAAEELWKVGESRPSVEVDAYLDRFRVELLPAKGERTPVRLLRVQPA